MKKVVSLLLVLCLTLGFSACADGMNAAEKALIALKKMDLETYASCMTSDADAEMSRILAAYNGLDEEEKETLVRVYSLLRYTIADTETERGSERVVSVAVKLPDIARLRTLSNAQIVFGKTANESVNEILDAQTAEMRETTWEITLVQQDGEWLIVYDEKVNGPLIQDLGLYELISFFAKH